MKEKETIQKITFPKKNSDWRTEIYSKLRTFKEGSIEIDTQEWSLNCKDLKELENLCNSLNLKIEFLESNVPETIVSSVSLGFRSKLKLQKNKSDQSDLEDNYTSNTFNKKVFFHQGTLRSGERLETDGDLLIVGDINPGAIVIAGGDVMIWGRLLGIAHAGKNGNFNAKISALMLRPVQLRIADKIARGPKERPEEGLAEEAIIQKGIIIIQPLKTK